MQKLRMSFILAIRGLWTNKMRSILTLLGMVIGIAAVITIVSLAEGLKSKITGQVEDLGSNLVWLFDSPSVNDRKEQARGQVRTFDVDSITLDELEIIAKASPTKVRFSPIVQRSVAIKYKNQKVFTEIMGVYAEYFDMSNLNTSDGDYFTTADVKGMRRVCLIGSGIKKDLFGNKDPIGQTLKIAGGKFEVLGTLEEKGGGFGDDPDSRIYVPYFTVQKQIFKLRDPYYSVFQVMDYTKMEDFKDETHQTMNQMRGITDPDDENYTLQSQTDALKELGGIIQGMVYVFGGIAAVSLLVGGIGIMNIMLVSVTERTREIGLRKAVGARKSDILMQFLIEAIVLCLIGGLFGMLVGYGGAYGLAALISKADPTMSWEASMSPLVVLVAVGISTLIGVIFGVYPASNAAKLHPIDALRYE